MLTPNAGLMKHFVQATYVLGGCAAANKIAAKNVQNCRKIALASKPFRLHAIRHA
jgi:hypothetical protein